MIKDHCVICGVETPYDRKTHIDMRLGYIEGAGQLCAKCWNEDNNKNILTIFNHIVHNTPNDMELGGKIRELYFEIKNK